jgi:ABC-2 type transport system permease protein
VKRFTLEQELELRGATIRAVESFLLDNLFRGQVSNEMLERAKSPVGFISTRLDKSGQVSTEQGGFITLFLVPYLFGVMFLTAVLMGSSTLLEGLSEEKENRIMEILISSVSVEQLLVGKIVGLGAAGLLQIIIWFGSARFVAGLASANIGGMFTELEIPTRLIVLGIVYFVLGYLLFGVLFTIVGAIVPTYREGQQLSYLFIPLGFMPLALTPFFAEHPSHAVTYVLTFFPVSTPVTSIIRIGGGSISSWELALTIVILLISIAGLLFFGARVFRAFLLMYGERPSVRKIVRILRQS